MAASYVGLIALDGTVSTGLLNPAIAAALILYQQFGNWQTQPLVSILENPVQLNVNKILSPFAGGVLAALLFLWQKTMMVDKAVNYSKDALRGSI